MLGSVSLSRYGRGLLGIDARREEYWEEHGQKINGILSKVKVVPRVSTEVALKLVGFGMEMEKEMGLGRQVWMNTRSGGGEAEYAGVPY